MSTLQTTFLTTVIATKPPTHGSILSSTHIAAYSAAHGTAILPIIATKPPTLGTTVDIF